MQRFLVGSGSNRGIPVAEVVVLHVLVDILLKIFGAIGLFPLCQQNPIKIPIRSRRL